MGNMRPLCRNLYFGYRFSVNIKDMDVKLLMEESLNAPEFDWWNLVSSSVW